MEQNNTLSNNSDSQVKMSVSKRTVFILTASVCVVLLIILFFVFRTAKSTQANACSQVAGQSCEQIACEGDQQGQGSCGGGTYCCKKVVSNVPQNQVAMVSDISNIQLANVDQSALTAVASELNIFNNQYAQFHDVHKALVQGIVKSVSVRITDISTAPLYYSDPTLNQSETSYGDTFDSRDGHLTIFLYYSDALIQRTSPTTLKNIFWHTALLALYQVTHPSSQTAVSSAQNTFINAHSNSVPFNVVKL